MGLSSIKESGYPEEEKRRRKKRKGETEECAAPGDEYLQIH